MPNTNAWCIVCKTHCHDTCVTRTGNQKDFTVIKLTFGPSCPSYVTCSKVCDRSRYCVWLLDRKTQQPDGKMWFILYSIEHDGTRLASYILFLNAAFIMHAIFHNPSSSHCLETGLTLFPILQTPNENQMVIENVRKFKWNAKLHP